MSVIGTDEQIQKFLEAVEPEESSVTEEENEEHFELERIVIPENSPLVGKTIAQSGIREKDSCLVVGIERMDGSFLAPTGNTVLKESDMLLDRRDKGPDRIFVAIIAVANLSPYDYICRAKNIIILYTYHIICRKKL